MYELSFRSLNYLLPIDAPIKDIASLTGVTINTVARRVILNLDATVLEALRQTQFDQNEISKYDHITLADLLSDGIPISGLFKTLLNFAQHVREQKGAMDSSADVDLFRSPRSGSRDRYATFLHLTILWLNYLTVVSTFLS